MNPSSESPSRFSAEGALHAGVSAFHGGAASRDPRPLDRESHAEFRLRLFMNASPFGIIEYELHPDDRLILVSANAAADRILNISCRTLFGLPLEEAFPNVTGTELPQTFRRVARTGEPLEMEQLTYQDERIAGIYEMYLFQSAPSRMAVMFRDVTAQRKHAEQLRASEEKLRLLAEHTDDLITLFDDKEVRHYVSPSYERITGWTLEDLQGQDWHLRIHPEDHALIEESDRANMAGRATQAEYRYFRKDGSMIWLQTLCTPIPDAEGKMTRFVARSIDITERKRQEQLQARSLQRITGQRSAIVGLATSPVIAAGDLNQAARLIAQTASQTLEIGRAGIWLWEQEEGRLTCLDLYEQSTGGHTSGTCLLAADYPRYFETLATGRAIDAEDACADPRTSEFTDGYLKKLGIVSMLDAPVRAGGRIVGTVCLEHLGHRRRWHEDEVRFVGELADQVAQAILHSQRKAADAALRESEKRLKSLFDGSPDAIFAIAVEEPDTGRIMSANPAAARMHGYSVEELLKMRIFDLDTPESARQARERMPELLSGRRMLYEVDHIRRDGSVFPMEVTAGLIEIQGRRHILAIKRDITDRKRSDEALRASEQRYKHLAEQNRRLLQEVNHRVKNNLAAVLGLVSLSLPRANDIDSGAAALKLRVLSMARAHDLLSQREWRDLELKPFAGTILEAIRQSLPSRGRLILQGPSIQIPPRFATPLALILQELMTNSTKHGAMSLATGQVLLEWSIQVDHWNLQWIESGGPPCPASRKSGVGLQLIEGLAQHDLGGTIQFDFPPAGAVCRLRLPMPGGEIDR